MRSQALSVAPRARLRCSLCSGALRLGRVVVDLTIGSGGGKVRLMPCAEGLAVRSRLCLQFLIQADRRLTGSK